MECAEKLFAEKGYAETSIRDIAKSADMNSAMISYYFGSKEGLVKGILDYRSTDLSKVFSSPKSTEDNSLQRMLDLINFYVEKVFEQRNFYKLLYQLQSNHKESVLIDYFNKIRQRNHELLKTIFDQGAKTGEFNPDIDVSMITSTLIGTLNHIVFNQSHYREVNKLDKLSDKKFIALLKDKTKKHLSRLISILIQ